MSHLPPLHGTGPSHSPRVNIPQRATIPSPLATVAVSPCTGESRLERNSPSVSDRDHWQLPKDIFDWQNIKIVFLGSSSKAIREPTDPSQSRGKLCVIDDSNNNNFYKNYLIKLIILISEKCLKIWLSFDTCLHYMAWNHLSSCGGNTQYQAVLL